MIQPSFAKHLLLLVLVWCPIAAQTDLIYPWVTNNDSFRGRLIINNLNGLAVTVSLSAEREPDAVDAVKTQTIELNLEPFGQVSSSAGELFDQLGEGTAYAVRLTSDASNITGALVNVGTQSQSGSSPAQANVFKASDAAPTWLFNYLFIGGGFSAPVLINLGSEDVQVNLYAFQGGARVGEAQVTVVAGKPWAEVVAIVFPELSGELYVVADAAGAQLLASAFIFNELEFLEPAMANAVTIDQVPDPSIVNNESISFTSQIQPMLTASCGGAGSNCHLNGGNQKGLILDAGSAYGNIVNKNSQVITSSLLVKPGDTTASYLYSKLLPVGNGVFYAGSRMPDPDSNIPALSEEEANLFRDWILQGALNN